MKKNYLFISNLFSLYIKLFIEATVVNKMYLSNLNFYIAITFSNKILF